ncbi:MAG: hypothetical protein K2Y21_00660 [Phycisphaerales bacterium]|nr:hypothetical protein [Phycisphaerales bacterium]
MNMSGSWDRSHQSSVLAPARWGRFALVGIAAASIASASMGQAKPETVTEDGIIAGTMNIDFATRTSRDSSGDLKQGSPAKGVKDKYTFSIAVAKTTEFSGEITRQPNLFTSTLGRKAQDAELFYRVDLAVLNPKDLKQKRTVGRMVGTVPVDPTSGAYDLVGGSKKESALRINVDAVGKASAFVDAFAGRLIGKAEKKESLASFTYKRLVGDRTVEVVVKKSDPMGFENIVLAKGPAEVYPRTVVNGRLDYDYETGNYFADRIRFKYSLDGQDFEDVITGTIKWVEDPDRATNGKGYYDFNLRFNEDKNKTASTEAAAFEKMSAEDAFFAVDNSVPCLTGRITYIDTIPAGSELPTSSKVTYSLNANKLTKQQVMNFFKLWLIAVGPTNDE